MGKKVFVWMAVFLLSCGLCLPQEKEDDVQFWAGQLKSEDKPAALKALRKLGNLTYKGANDERSRQHQHY